MKKKDICWCLGFIAGLCIVAVVVIIACLI